MAKTQTPQALPETGRVFSVVLPDSEIFFALFLGAIEALFQSWYWAQSEGGLTPEETIEAFEKVMEGVRYDTGIPE